MRALNPTRTPLRVYVYDMPSEFTPRLLQYRPGAGVGLRRVRTGAASS